MRFARVSIAAWLGICVLSGCGTYSFIRPADNLKSGQVEIAGGVAANGDGEALPVVRGTVGLTDWMELGLQYEIYSYLSDIRFGLLTSEDHGIALALGFQGGLIKSDDSVELDQEALGPALSVGRRWDEWEIYLGAKGLSNLGIERGLVSGKLGGRYTWPFGLVVGLEGGSTVHIYHGFDYWVGEGTLYTAWRL